MAWDDYIIDKEITGIPSAFKFILCQYSLWQCNWLGGQSSTLIILEHSLLGSIEARMEYTVKASQNFITFLQRSSCLVEKPTRCSNSLVMISLAYQRHMILSWARQGRWTVYMRVFCMLSRTSVGYIQIKGFSYVTYKVRNYVLNIAPIWHLVSQRKIWSAAHIMSHRPTVSLVCPVCFLNKI